LYDLDINSEATESGVKQKTANWK